jgi:DNA invertase Pin-like site-specific DNA recombinase
MGLTAIYCRVSTDSQVNGLESQVRALESYCEANGITEYKLYRELGVSGAKANRPILDQMVKDCEEGRVSTVMVYSFSRFARSTKHLILALEQFNKLNIRFISLTESVDTKSPLGKCLFQIIASIGELEREMIRGRVKAGLLNAKAKGKVLGAKRKYDNPAIFRQLRAKGLTIREIANTVKCSTATVIRMLSNSDSETYVKKPK